MGGGGGNGGFSVAGSFSKSGAAEATSVGGGGGDGNIAGDVKVVNNFAGNSTSYVETAGDLSIGVLAQSIGGGGGNGGFSVSGAGSIDRPSTPAPRAAAPAPAISPAMSQVSTQGQFAPGLVGQTIGGGGGFGAVTAASGLSATGVSFQLGSTGGVGGSADPSNGSTWTVGAGSITTTGALSNALVAQAIGAGGGLAGFVSSGSSSPLAAAVLGAAGGATGAGSNVTLAN